MPTPPSDELAPAPEQLDPQIDDPESQPAIPAAALAARAAVPAGRVARGGTVTELEIWRLAWPVILSQVLASVVALADAAMVGRLSRESIAAVGYTTQFLNLAQSVLFAVGIACIALMSRAVGARQPGRARSALAAALVLSGVLGTLFTVVVLIHPHTLLGWLDAEPAVIDVAVPYFRLSLGSTLFLAVSVTFESAFRAIQDTRTPLIIAGFVAVAKIVLNALLIFGTLGFPRLELVGAGLATLLSEGAGFALFWIASRRGGEGSLLRVSRAEIAGSHTILPEMVRIALPAIGERVLLNLAIMAYFKMLGHYGTVEIAAYTIGTRLLSFSWIPGTGFSVAAATLVGHALGAEDPAAARRAGWRAARLALAVSAVLGLVFGLARMPLARIFTNDREVVEALGPFMLMLALAQPPMGLHFTLGGALRGAGDTWNPLLAASLGNWGFRVPLAWLFARGLTLDVAWVWAALIADHCARAVWMTLSFRGGRWYRRLGLGDDTMGGGG